MRKVCTTCGSRRVMHAFALVRKGSDKRKSSCRHCVAEYAADWRLKRGHVPGAVGAPSGERNGNAKLTAEDVASIRSYHLDDGMTQVELAHLYGVTPSHLSRLISGESWKGEED